jgi:hypothetical protein
MDQNQTSADGGLGALLDFGFKKFITLSVIKVLYLLGIALIGLSFLLMLATSFTMGAAAVVGVLILGPIIALLYLIFFRIWLELVVVIFRIGENTSKIVEMRGGPPTPPPTVMP